uniref:TolC family protein n=1 Tax=Variovorax sp. E3 TaxID=1914993 RepID=UPI0018DCE130
ALGLPADLARRRPDIAAAEAQLHAATARIGVAVADLYPRVTLGAGFGYESVGGDSFTDWGSRQWHVGPSISLPLFDGGRRRGTIELRELQQQEAAVAFQQTVLKAWHEIDTALTGYTAERRRQAELAERERRSRDALVLAHARYAGGLTDFGVELDARRALLQARRDQAQSTSRLAVGLVAVYKALGGEAPLQQN